jgi:6-phosphogluconolactonase
MPEPAMRQRLASFALLGLLASLIGVPHMSRPLQAADTDELKAYIGTYTNDQSEGIYLLQLSIAGDEIKSSKLTLAGKAANPSFLALHPGGKLLYAVNESDFRGKQQGAVSAFRINADGTLALINQQSTLGGAPCHLVVDKTGTNVLVANYSGGNVVSYHLTDDGALSEPVTNIVHKKAADTVRGPHAHSINVDAANRFAFAADLGLDKILVYKLDEKTGQLTPHDPPAASVPKGGGPRHFAFHPSGKFAYAINESDMTMTAFDYDADAGKLTPIETVSTIPEEITDRKGFSTAEVQVHPSGKFLYGSNRGHHTIAVFSIDEKTGKIQRIANHPIRGKTPRNFGISPDGKYLLALGQESSTIAVFRVDPSTGKLTAIGEPIEAPVPVCVKFVK